MAMQLNKVMMISTQKIVKLSQNGKKITNSSKLKQQASTISADQLIYEGIDTNSMTD